MSVPRGEKRLLVERSLSNQGRQWRTQPRAQESVPASGGPADAVGADRRDRERRVRPGAGFGKDGHVAELPVLSRKGHPLLGPRLDEHVDTFLETRPAVVESHAMADELEGSIPAPHSDDESAAAQDVERGGFLGEPERVMERHDIDRRANADALGAAASVAASTLGADESP